MVKGYFLLKCVKLPVMIGLVTGYKLEIGKIYEGYERCSDPGSDQHVYIRMDDDKTEILYPFHYFIKLDSHRVNQLEIIGL